MRRTILALAVSLCAIGCGSDQQPAAPTAPVPTPAATPPASRFSISNFTAQNVGKESTCQSGGRTDVMIDELSFRFENPGGRSLAGLYVTNDQSADLRWGPIEPCSPTLCAARFPPAAPAPETACIVEGTATSSSGTLRLFTKQYFLPSVSYRIALGDPANNGGPLTIVSNVAEASVIRMPGVRNDQVAFYDVVPNAPQRTGSDYVASGTAYFYFPPQLVASPYRTEVQFSWYHSDGRLFAMYRTIVGGLGIRIAGVSSSAPTNGRPPWRMVIRMRQTSGAADPNGVSFTCNNDRPYPGQARCTTDQLPAAPGPVLTEDSREALTAGI